MNDLFTYSLLNLSLLSVIFYAEHYEIWNYNSIIKLAKIHFRKLDAQCYKERVNLLGKLNDNIHFDL